MPMPTLSDLPGELVLLILRLAGSAPTLTLRSWKTKLPLLAVCRRWRHLAQRIVYCQAFVECRRAQPGAGLLGRTGARAWRTNIELAAAVVEHGDFDRQLVLSAVGGPRLDEQLGEMAVVLQQHPAVCAGIRSLTIRGHAAGLCGDVSGSASAAVMADDGDFAKAAAALAAAIPNVTQLYVGACANEAAAGAVGGMLVDAWASRLRRIDCQAPVALLGPGFARELTHLSITLGPGAGPGERLPRVCAGTLRVLHLRQVPARFAWADAFGDGDAPQDPVCFASLAELRLGYRSTGPADWPDACGAEDPAAASCVRLRFPLLQRCHIDGCPPQWEFFASVRLPPSMERLSLAGAPESVLALSRAGLERTGALELRVNLPGDSGGTRAFCRATNQLFGQVEVGGEATLDLHEHRAELDPQLIAWPRMTRLSIHGQCEFDVVAGIVQRAEALRRLEVYGLTLGCLATDVTVPDVGGAVLPPLRTRIETLTLHGVMDGPCSARTAGAVQYLLLRLRLLRRANLSTGFGVHAADLKRRFGSLYPHIQTATVKTY